LRRAKELVQKYDSLSFQIANTINEAEVVLYLENGYIGLGDLPELVARVRSAPSAMHFIFGESDWPFPVLPGAYPSLTKPYAWAQSWSFLPRPQIAENTPNPLISEPEFLFSFLGRISTHPIRKAVLALDKKNTPCLDVTNGPRRFPDFHFSQTYFSLIKRSKFVLCPRGFGASTIRIFEAMRYGRVPVIISDQWQPPVAIPWKEFGIRVPENEVNSIPRLLHGLEEKANAMGKLAQNVYDSYFGSSVFLDRLLSSLLSNYSNCSFTTEAILRRACRTLGWREIRTLCHQGRAWALSSFRAR
jgi:glycosyltransferase involved in cell wall biosynthesis